MMDCSSDLLIEIQSFLRHDLGALLLPPAIDARRRVLLGRIDACAREFLPSGSDINRPSIVPVQRRTMGTASSVLVGNRYSLPSSMCYPSHSSDPNDSCWPSSNSCKNYDDPPLPPKGTHRISLKDSGPDHDYEVPKAILSQARLSTCATTDSNENRVVRRSAFNRHSLSPQLEIVQNSNQTTTKTAQPVAALVCTMNPADSKDDIALTLPKKCLSNQPRRFSAFMDPSWTLAGSLHHRYKPNKWTRLSLCLLTGNSRLVAYKSGHSLTPNLVLFLCGATGIYAGRDSGMDHVIKIAHPTRGTAVLAADTEEQALAWIKQINQYAQGIRPPEAHSFLEQTTLLNSLGPGYSSRTSLPATVDNPDTGPPNGPSEIQEDSGLSAPVSSNSENNSGDGVVSFPNNSLLSDTNTTTCLSPASMLSSSIPSHSPAMDVVDIACGLHSIDEIRRGGTVLPISNGSFYGTDSFSAHSSRNTISSGFRAFSRREGILSSVRRKVESFNSKRRARKSLPQTSEAGVEGKFQLEKASSSIELNTKKHKRTSSEGIWNIPLEVEQSIAAPLPAAACTGKAGTGFGWGQLESAANLLLHPVSTTLSSSVGYGRRPRSVIVASSSATEKVISNPNHGNLLDLSELHRKEEATDTSRSFDRIIIAGDACISIPGKVPWTIRWCCLRSRCLDIYPLAKQPNDSNNTLNDRPPHTSCWPLFSLPLEPGQVELGLAGDKRHKAAVRLAVPKQSSTPLLFDAPDKLRMGAWIRGFIEALGIIPPENNVAETLCPSGDPRPEDFEKSKLAGAVQTKPNVIDYDVPSTDFNRHSSARMQHFTRPRTLMTRPVSWMGNSSQFPVNEYQLQEVTDEDLSDIRSESGSANVYDEVCPPQSIASSQDLKSSIGKRRWSSPLFPFDNPSKPWMISSRKESEPSETPVSSLSSENHRILLPASINRGWYIPPPSRRLLAQPLPPLPSVGPSGAESMAGTIASSHASSSLTPDETCGPRADEPTSQSPSSEPDTSVLMWALETRSGVTRLSKHLSTCDPNTPLSSPSMRWQSPTTNQRRHASVGNLDHLVEQPIDHSFAEGDSSRYRYVQNPCLSNCKSAAIEFDVTALSSHTGYTLVPNDAHSLVDSRRTSATHLGFQSDLSLALTSDQPVPTWNAHLQTELWYDDPASMKPPNPTGARRSVSCITGTKPSLGPITEFRTASTLPPRHEYSVFSCLDSTRPLSTEQPMIPLSTGVRLSNHTSSDSSRTATSSGVAMTAGSLSSPGSTGTTRPPSLAISWPAQPTLEEEEHDSLEPDSDNAQPEQNKSKEITSQIIQSTPSKVPLEVLGFRPPYCEKVTNCIGDSQHPDAVTHCTADYEPVSCGVHDHSPNHTSLILAATQLEEVQNEAKNLHSRRQTLSFRLSQQLVRGRKERSISGTSDISDGINSVHSKNSDDLSRLSNTADAGSLSETELASEPVTSESLQDVNAHGQISTAKEGTEHHEMEGVDGEDEGEEEATASLCARLAAVELLIRQAESTEARLRDQVNQFMAICSNPLKTLPSKNNNNPSAHNRPSTLKVDQSNMYEPVCGECGRQCHHSLTNQSSQPNRRRGRNFRNSAQPLNPNMTPSTDIPSNSAVSSRGRGGARGGRSRRRFGGGGQPRNRKQAWSKAQSPSACAVAMSPAS
ncbi:unnamed protein product [Calicophoron daubneyi]|uniref:PH domain-containing protein n=1 Tax=Calicophoron daubneyi TaxID=300641 RepID=A0AAV2TVN3_CALDB